MLPLQTLSLLFCVPHLYFRWQCLKVPSNFWWICHQKGFIPIGRVLTDMGAWHLVQKLHLISTWNEQKWLKTNEILLDVSKYTNTGNEKDLTGIEQINGRPNPAGKLAKKSSIGFDCFVCVNKSWIHLLCKSLISMLSLSSWSKYLLKI